MRLGLIAGNGRFPFLTLEAMKRLGHAVTVIAIREEASPAIAAAAAADPAAAVHWVWTAKGTATLVLEGGPFL